MRILTYLLVAAFATYLSISLALAGERPIIIAVIDTGYTAPKRDSGVKPRLCHKGHADLTGGLRNYDLIPPDDNGHGTNIVHVIANQIGNDNGYCMVILKYWTDKLGSASNDSSGEAMKLARNLKVDVVNFSSSGGVYNEAEETAIQAMLDYGATVVVSAGNGDDPKKNYEGSEVDTFPARLDSRIVVVGNLKNDGTRHETSNYGKLVTRWEIGTNVCGGGSCLTGTSQATAVATGKIVKKMLNERKKKCSKKLCQSSRKSTNAQPQTSPR